MQQMIVSSINARRRLNRRRIQGNVDAIPQISIKNQCGALTEELPAETFQPNFLKLTFAVDVECFQPLGAIVIPGGLRANVGVLMK